MERLRTEAETPVAPHEVRELLTRLTEAHVESMAVDETRTLGGLAMETGIPIDRLQQELSSMRGKAPVDVSALRWLVPVALLAATAGIGGYLFNATAPKPEPAPTTPVSIQTPAAEVSTAGLVGLDQVTFGPDSGPYRVDNTFEPAHATPKGVSIAVGVGQVLWGSGDHRSKVIQGPLSPEDESVLRENLTELLKYVREGAAARNIKPTPGTLIPGFSYKGDAFFATAMTFTYYGTANVSLPLPPPGVDDAVAARQIKTAVNKAVDQLQSQLRWHRDVSRPAGP